ncbi:MAG: hypothetical protein Q7S74_03255 [Nanoarchaeota archaeon]|nr:hypothetical protein [Nanoarchaeota archaeon]
MHIDDSDEEDQGSDDEFNLFNPDLENILDAGYDKSKWGFNPEQDFLKDLQAHLGEDYEAEFAGKGWVSIQSKNADQIAIAREMYEKILVSAINRDLHDLAFVYNLNDELKIGAIKRIDGINRKILLNISNIPTYFPTFLEDALKELYNVEVRELDMEREVTFEHTPYKESSGEVPVVFRSTLKRVPVKNANAYHVNLVSLGK